jgi:hypothetical protein
MITDLVLLVACHFHFVMVMVFCILQNAKQNVTQFPNGHKSAANDPPWRALEESHRRQLLALKYGHNSDVCHLQSRLQTVDFKFMRLSADFDWISNLYQDSIRLVQEQEDRIAYLESRLHEFGHTTSTARQPYSAPASQINFNQPPRRSRTGTAVVAPSPLSNVSALPHSYYGTSTEFAQVIEVSKAA